MLKQAWQSLRSPEVVTAMAVYGLLVRLLWHPGEPLVLLGALLLALLAQFGARVVAHRAQVHADSLPAAEHQAALEALRVKLAQATEWISTQANAQAFRGSGR